MLIKNIYLNSLKNTFFNRCPLFLHRNFNSMVNDINEEIQEHKEKDLGFNWVLSSRFLFYVTLFCIIAFFFGTCLKLYDKSYSGQPDVEVPDNTLYTPKYK
ncbi:MAG: hypothetical protein JWR18_3398 [Segetibacter sp.]|nr:hypothetical protein [Segetibacter sp.]